MTNQSQAPLTRAALLCATLLGALLLGACASKSMTPPDSLAEARGAIARAEQSDGRQYAGGALDNAKQKLEMAEMAVADEDMPKAKRLADEAVVAARLVSARTRAAKTQETAQNMEQGAKALTEEMRRKGEQ